jgi:MATE family multidrug resistance protein
MVFNVALNWVFIYGHLGAEPMGVKGAAIASALATLLAFLFLFVLFVKRVGVPGASPSSTGTWSLAEFVRLLRFGVPSGFNWFIEFLAFSFFINVVMPVLGTTSVAALMSVMQLNSMAFMPAFALASAGAIFVGQAIGANARDDVPRTVRITLFAAVGWEAIIADDATPEAAARFLAVGASMLVLSSAWQIVDATSMVYSEALRAAGDTTFTFVARFAAAWLVFVPGAWLTVRKFGGDEKAAVLWLAGYLALLALALWLRFRSNRWRQIELVEEAVV